MPGAWNLPESAQKQVSTLSAKITNQKNIIVKAKAVLESKGETYVCNRARTTLASCESKLSKAKAEYEAYVKDLEEKAELQRKIIWEETHKTSPTIIMAEKEIEILQSQIDAIKKVNTPTPIVVPNTVSKDECDEYESVTVSMSDLFHEGRLDGKPLGPSYIHSYYYAEPKPSGSRQTVYGAVSEIAKGKKVGESFPA
jgi:hypothetical protein